MEASPWLLIVFLVFLLWPVALLIGSAVLVRKIHQRYKRTWLTTASAFLIINLLTIDLWFGIPKFEDLCANEAGLKINRSVDGVEGVRLGYETRACDFHCARLLL